jgi:N-acetylglucosamine-6-phosphate deacetylase
MATTLLAHGVAAFVAALMTAPLTDLLAAAGRAERPADPQGGTGEVPHVATLLGLHLEGPALSPDWSAGHDAAALTSPLELSRSLASAPEAWRSVRIVTLAPELEGGLQLVDDLVRAGIVASIGHTGASVDVATRAYESGARSTTHLFNGMPPLHHRAPGPVGAALAWAPFIELICDGLHVDARIMPSLARAIGDDRLVLVSDAVPLAGSRLRSVRVPGSSARIEAGRAVHLDGTLAGSRLLLDGMVANAVRSGVPLTSALRAATENPARLLVLRDRGTLTEGSIADLVVVSRAGRLRRVLTSGLAA